MRTMAKHAEYRGENLVAHRIAAVITTVLLLTACGVETANEPASAPAAETIPANAPASTASRIIAAEPQNWLAHGRTYDEQRFSPLDTINTKTVGDLSLAWYFDTNTTRGLEATPIIVDGVMYSTGTWSVVYAHNAATGELLWNHDPQVPRRWGYNACCDVVNRGVAVSDGRVFVGTLDGRLQALNAANGKVVWEQLTIDPERPYTITGAPRVVNGKVVIGNGGAELGVRGYVTAYDAVTGDQAWRFYTVPGNPAEPFEHPELEQAAKTWRGGKWWEVGGGGTAWDAMAFDPALNLLYVGVGNGSPWTRYERSPGGGDNLYLASIIALNPDTGRLAWHYQTTPGDNWDYTAVQQMILADITINDTPRKVIMQAPKNGFFYVLDRETGELISAETYVPITWATHVDLETGRPVEDPRAHYTNEYAVVHPGPAGGHNWHPMSFSPLTGLVYIPVVENRMAYAQLEGFEYDRRVWNTGVDFSNNEDLDDDFKVETKLVAWDPVARQPRWTVAHGRPGASGVMATAGGLVFQPGSDCSFSAFDAASGDKVWETTIQMGTIAAPVSYEVDGEQYIAFMSGWGGAPGLYGSVPCADGRRATTGRILAFKLGGTASLPPAAKPAPIPKPPPRTADQQMVDAGEALYRVHCFFCHSLGPDDPGVVPNLARTSSATHQVWDAIVRGGAYEGKGMIGFDHLLSEDESYAIQAYVIDRAHVAAAERLAAQSGAGR